VGGFIVAQHWPNQQLFFVPMLPLAVAALATFVLILRKVDVRGEAGAAH
jgi:hypothetical protein